MSFINMVKFFFLKGIKPKSTKETQALTTLAYQNARKHSQHPKQILIRPDPNGNHFTFSSKTKKQMRAGTHVTSHGYTPSPTNYNLTKAVFTPEKPDSTRIGRGKKTAWPDKKDLVDGPEIGYKH
ncbi:hypothetical protein GQ44DRAFT_667992 [Phaeosphaeriaceae sp. PMI808]|nr:hypothetical protein GQ44DRAFT_667992 [Phaeosphaeriaceae sp. PMI808]